MIGSLEGDVLSVSADGLLLDVNGIGFSLRMPARDLAGLHAGGHERILTVMTVSQDAIALYGFLSASSKTLFTQLQKVSGVGPKAAMAILSTLSPEELGKAIHDNDVTALTRAPGVGKKGAQKIILELHGSIDFSSLDEAPASRVEEGGLDSSVDQVIQGLSSLGWQRRDAYQATMEALGQLGLTAPLTAGQIPQVLRKALSDLDRGR